MIELSENHSVNIVLALQETWKYDIPLSFRKEFENRYYFLHESAMTINAARSKGRPFGGVAFIISKSVAFKIKYNHSRCISILLTKPNILLNNVYMPTYDRTITAEENRHKLMEAVGHLEAAHTISDETIDCITLGDFNYDPKDVTEHATFVNEMLQSRSYDLKSDTKFKISGTYTHKCGRTLDRIIATTV